MPRPGPRPYECIRRAWHNDENHSAVRCTVREHISNIAKETHTAKTIRNSEYKKMLPLLVYKAEKILYSKANSEAEYIDMETLKARLEDAINTIIRRDESTEKGVCLPPCVEAALCVGCHPMKSPRGQRFNSRPSIKHNEPEASNSYAKEKLRDNKAIFEAYGGGIALSSRTHPFASPYVPSMFPTHRVDNLRARSDTFPVSLHASGSPYDLNIASPTLMENAPYPFSSAATVHPTCSSWYVSRSSYPKPNTKQIFGVDSKAERLIDGFPQYAMGPCKGLPNDAKASNGYFMTKACSAFEDNGCDLLLRLGPSSSKHMDLTSSNGSATCHGPFQRSQYHIQEPCDLHTSLELGLTSSASS